MSRKLDQSYTSRGIFREETLYYDLGYRFSSIRGRKPVRAINIDLTSFLLMVSILLQFLASIRQIFTIGLLVVYYVYSSYFSGKEEKATGLWILVLIMIVFIMDHIIGGISIAPGNVLSAKMTALAWVLEITWILLYSTQLLIVLQPTTAVIDKNRSVMPESDLAKAEYRSLRQRIQSTDYEVKSVKNIIDIELLRNNFVYLLQVIALIVAGILIIDFFIWQIVGSFGGGKNIRENYFISGLVFVLLFFLFSSTNLLYPSDAIGSNIEQSEVSDDNNDDELNE